MTQTNDSKVTTKKIFDLMKDYFLHSDEKLFAWLLLIGIVISIIALVVLMAGLAWWSAAFWAILTAKVLGPFLVSIGEMLLIVTGLVGFTVLKNYLVGKLSICWRNWLTQKILKELFEGANNYLDLSRFPEVVDNISQRIQEDVRSFVDLALNLSSNFFKSVLSLFAFTGTLWVVGGALTFALFGLNIVIPGFLVWVAIIVAIVATITTHLIAKNLPKINQENEKAEADFRREITQLDKAENIALNRAETHYKANLDKTLQRITDSADEKLVAQTKLTAFQNFYYNVAEYIPLVFAAPLYFTGLIQMGQLVQIGMSFKQVSISLSMIVTAYEDIAKCKASVDRIIELKTAMREGLPDSNPKSVTRTESNDLTIEIDNLSLRHPQASSTSYLFRNLSLKLAPGENVLIKAPSGIGKTTLFKAIFGTYQYGEGKISSPSQSIYCLTQEATMPYGTLRDALAYPQWHSETHFSDEVYVAALTEVGLDDYCGKLSLTRNWASLSGGEQQRVAAARAVIRKPAIIFADEATAALDEENEAKVYKALVATGATIFSIGHRSTITPFHNKVLQIKVKDQEERTLELEEIKVGIM